VDFRLRQAHFAGIVGGVDLAALRRQIGQVQAVIGTDEDLQRAAPLFTTAWLFDVLPRALGLDQPNLHNSEGDEVVFHEVTFPLTPAASPEAVALRLDELQELRQESSTFWNWLSEAAATRPAAESENALLWNVTMEDGSVVLGNIELKERTLVLSVNSAARGAGACNAAERSGRPGGRATDED